MKTILGYIDGIGFKGFYLIGDLWIIAFIGILFGVFFSLKRKKGMFAAAGIAAGIYLICDLWLLQLCWDLPYGYDLVGLTVVIIASIAFGAAISFLMMVCILHFLPKASGHKTNDETNKI